MGVLSLRGLRLCHCYLFITLSVALIDMELFVDGLEASDEIIWAGTRLFDGLLGHLDTLNKRL